MPRPPCRSLPLDPLSGFPSTANLSECREMADTFSDLRSWLRQMSGCPGGISAAGLLLSCEQRRAVFNFLERVATDPIRKNLAKELLVKLAAEESWFESVSKERSGSSPTKQMCQIVSGRSASVSGSPLSADPIRHKLARNLLSRIGTTQGELAGCVATTDATRIRSGSRRRAMSSTLPCYDAVGSVCPQTSPSSPRKGEVLPITITFCVPQACHHKVVGKRGEEIGKLQDTHHVTIRVPKPEEDSEAIAVSGTPSAVESCRKTLENLLHIPVGAEALDIMVLGVPRASYGAIIGERGATLQRLMSECFVLVEIPRPENPGDVTLRGHMKGCVAAKEKIEEILRDTVQVLSSHRGIPARLSLPPSFSLVTPQPINKCLFFPEMASQQPGDGLTSLDTLLKYLDSTRICCDVCVFTITDNRITRRLLDAHRYRNVRVRIVTDKAQCEALGSDIVELQAAGIQVRMNTEEHLMHHKFCILDGRVLMNGSFNWTQSACESNQENVVVTNAKALVAPFCVQFEKLWEEYAPKCFRL